MLTAWQCRIRFILCNFNLFPGLSAQMGCLFPNKGIFLYQDSKGQGNLLDSALAFSHNGSNSKF